MKTADQEAHAEEISGGTVEAQGFDVTPVTPYGARVIRARANEHIGDEGTASGVNPLAICHQGNASPAPANCWSRRV